MATSSVIGWFADIGLNDRPHVGGKGGSLGELQRAGIAVPPGFVVKTGAFERFLVSLEREFRVRARIEALQPDALDEVRECCSEVRARVEAAELPSDVLAEISAAHTQLCGDSGAPVAVRLSISTNVSPSTPAVLNCTAESSRRKFW